MLNILVLCDFGNATGGAERVAIDSAAAFARAGHQVHFVAAIGPAAQELLDAGVHVHIVGISELKKKSALQLIFEGLWSFKAARITKRLLSQMDPKCSVVHVHSWQRGLTASVLRAAINSEVPTVVTLHEYGLACPNQGFFDYQQMKICKRKALSPGCLMTHCDTRTYLHKLWRVTRVLLQRAAALVPGKVRHVIYLSELSRSVLKPYFDANAIWHDVRNPIGFERQPRVSAETNRKFVFVGRVCTEKGIELFLQAARECKVQAVVVGDGPELESCKSRYPEVSYLGWVSSDEIKKQLNDARGFVFPSLWYEGLPLAVQEAKSMGVPAIVANGTAAREIVDDGISGLHFEHQDYLSLVEAISRLDRDDELARQLSVASYDSYWSNPPLLDVHVARLTEVYLRMVNNPGMRPC